MAGAAAQGGLARRLGRMRREELFTSGHTEGLKATSVRGGTVTLAAQFIRLVVQTGAMMMITRLLSPDDFGLQGMVTAVTGVVSLFRDAGLSVATVQRPVITHAETSTLFWINVALGGLLMVLTAALAPVLVLIFKEPRLLWMTIVSAAAFFLNGLCVQHQALLQRALRFTTIAQIDLLGLLVCSVLGVVMAKLGCGYWALVGMTLGGPVVGLIGAWLMVPWVPGRPSHVREVLSHLLFGGTITLNMLLVYVAYNLSPAFILGRSFGTEAVGVFTRAYQLINMPMHQLNNSVFNVAFPALSRMQHDVAMLCRAFLKGYSIQLALNIPITLCSALFAKELVRVLLGPKWPAAVPVLLLLTPAILGFSLINPLGWFMMATGRATRSLHIAFVLTPVVILGVWLGSPDGAEGVAAGFSAAIALLSLPIVAWAIHGTGIRMRDYFETVSRPLLAGLVAGLAGWLTKAPLVALLPAEPKLQAVLVLLCGSAFVCAVFAFMLLIVLGQRDMYVDLARQAIQRRRGKEAVA
jgi:O-antigen/teichoic acid export membrane protein